MLERVHQQREVEERVAPGRKRRAGDVGVKEVHAVPDAGDRGAARRRDEEVADREPRGVELLVPDRVSRSTGSAGVGLQPG